MTCLVFASLVGFGCLIVGWFILPAPAFIQKFWINRGWADRV